MDRVSFYAVAVHFVAAKTKDIFVLAGSLVAGETIDLKSANVFDLDFRLRSQTQINWALVELDDMGVDANGDIIAPSEDVRDSDGMHINTVGPMWPYIQRSPGTVYLTQKKLDDVRVTFERDGRKWPGEGANEDGLPYEPYQFESVGYGIDRSRRFHGFRVTTKDVRDGMLMLEVELHATTREYWRSVWVDSRDSKAFEGPAAALTKGYRGPAYLGLQFCAAAGLMGPKLPPGGGGK